MEPTHRANPVNRVVAKIIDLLIVMAAAAILPVVVGPLLGFFYSLLADGIHYGPFQSQSIGKKLLGLRVMSVPRDAPANWRDSMIRNAPVGVATFFAIIPVWGWIILILVGLPLMAIEVYLMFRTEQITRLGDLMADTEVIELVHHDHPEK